MSKLTVGKKNATVLAIIVLIVAITASFFIYNTMRTAESSKIVVVNDAVPVFMQPVSLTASYADQHCIVQYGGTLFRIGDMPKGYDADWNEFSKDRMGQTTAYLATYIAPAAPEPPSPIKSMKNCADGMTVSISVAKYRLFSSGKK